MQMSESPHSPSALHPAGPDGTGRRSSETTIDPNATLALLSDEHARAILEELGEEPLSAREIFDRLDVSRATVYRRLERLESAGLVTSSTAIHPDGHHRDRFDLALNRIHVRVGHDGPTAAGA
jgi:DNA-binding transcriptional ArsR family regulator